jgi:hypothetical protein
MKLSRVLGEWPGDRRGGDVIVLVGDKFASQSDFTE